MIFTSTILYFFYSSLFSSSLLFHNFLHFTFLVSHCLSTIFKDNSIILFNLFSSWFICSIFASLLAFCVFPPCALISMIWCLFLHYFQVLFWVNFTDYSSYFQFPFVLFLLERLKSKWQQVEDAVRMTFIVQPLQFIILPSTNKRFIRNVSIYRLSAINFADDYRLFLCVLHLFDKHFTQFVKQPETRATRLTNQ